MRYSILVVLAACQSPVVLTLPEPAPRPATPIPTEPPPPPGVQLTAVGYNVESGDATAERVAENIVEVQGEVIWGFSEAQDQSWLDTFAEAADDGGQDFQTILGSTGFSDRLGIVYDANTLDLIGSEELFQYELGARAPLVAEFEVIENGARFLYMVNHLWRTEDDSRNDQAVGLNTWVGEQTLPVVAMGDYNFDWAIEDGENDHDQAYDSMVAGDRWLWVEPVELVPTQCNFSNPAILDFAFLGGDARSWEASSEVLFTRAVHCQDDEFKPDHRPVQLTFAVPDPPAE